MLKSFIINALLAASLPVAMLIGGVLITQGCTSALERHARAKHRACAVEVLGQDRRAIRVRVACPGRAPFEETIKER